MSDVATPLEHECCDLPRAARRGSILWTPVSRMSGGHRKLLFVDPYQNETEMLYISQHTLILRVLSLVCPFLYALPSRLPLAKHFL